MQVSSFQIDNILRTYNKHQRTKVRVDANHEPLIGNIQSEVPLGIDSRLPDRFIIGQVIDLLKTLNPGNCE